MMAAVTIIRQPETDARVVLSGILLLLVILYFAYRLIRRIVRGFSKSLEFPYKDDSEF
jgi:hypothetical protein